MAKKKILIIDDEPDFARALIIRLESQGSEAIYANDGDTGLAKVEKGKPDLIILDLMLPNLGGFWICKTLKSQDKYKDIPIIILTDVYKFPEDEKQALALGADAYIEKPFEPQVLLDKIQELLR